MHSFPVWFAVKEVNLNNIYALLIEDLDPKKYSDLGLAFGLKLVDIHKIETEFPRQSNRHLQEIIQTWINRCTQSSQASWNTLAQKLEAIYEFALASKVASFH